MTIYFDSTDNIITLIRIDGQEFISEVSSPRDQNIRKFIKATLEKLGLSPQNLTSIEVNPGPGSFTGTRIGVTIANALGFSLNIKVNGQKPPIEVVYGQDPSITTTSKKVLISAIV